MRPSPVNRPARMTRRSEIASGCPPHRGGHPCFVISLEIGLANLLKGIAVFAGARAHRPFERASTVGLIQMP
jgi:hypothetical protein